MTGSAVTDLRLSAKDTWPCQACIFSGRPWQCSMRMMANLSGATVLITECSPAPRYPAIRSFLLPTSPFYMQGTSITAILFGTGSSAKRGEMANGQRQHPPGNEQERIKDTWKPGKEMDQCTAWIWS